MEPITGGKIKAQLNPPPTESQTLPICSERERGEMAEEKNGKEVTENVVSEADALPKAIVRRVVKDKLSQLSAESDISVLRDSLQAFSESARIFIHYLSATANDICKESNRQVINPEDVFKALEEIEYPEFIGPLRAALEEFREKNAGRKSASSKAKDTNKKAEKKEPPKAKETNKKAERKDPSKAKDINKKAEKKEQPKAKDNNKKAEKKEPPKAKDTNKKAKRKEPPSPSEGQKKRHVVESDGDKEDSD